MLSMPAVVAIIASWTMSLAYPSGQDSPGNVTVSVVTDTVRISEGQLVFRLHNAASAAVTAWRVAADYVFADGTSQRIVYGREGYLALSGLAPPSLAGGRVVQPGSTTEVAIPLPEHWPPVTTVHLQLETAIFANGSAVGPKAEIDALFARRIEDRVAWSRVRAAFDEARRGGTGDAVARAMDDLDFPGDATRGHRVVVSSRKDLERLINGESRAQGDRPLNAILTEWVARADAYIAAATKHSARR
jgi:hypothetical protein